MIKKYRLITLSIIILLSSSCKNYVQLYTVGASSSNISNNQYYVFSNDTLKIYFGFWDEKGRLSFLIENTSKKSVYIDWKKSSYIVNSKKVDFWSDEQTIRTYSTTTSNSKSKSVAKIISSTNWFNEIEGYSNLYSEINTKQTTYSESVIHKQEKISFLPPKSYYSTFDIPTYILLNNNFILNKATPYIVENRTDKSNKKTKVFVKEFNSDNSPHKFSLFITYSFKEDFIEEQTIRCDFYISKISEMREKHFDGVTITNVNYSGEGTIVKEYPFKSLTKFYLSIPKREAVEKRLPKEKNN